MAAGLGNVSQKGKLFKKWSKLFDISTTLGTSVSEVDFIKIRYIFTFQKGFIYRFYY